MYPVECADTARRGVREEPAVQQKDAPDEVEAQEHRQRQQQVDGHLRCHETFAEIPRFRRKKYTAVHNIVAGWLGSRVVSVLDSGAVGPGFKSQLRRCRVTVLGKLFTPIVPLFTEQRDWKRFQKSNDFVEKKSQCSRTIVVVVSFVGLLCMFRASIHGPSLQFLL